MGLGRFINDYIVEPFLRPAAEGIAGFFEDTIEEIVELGDRIDDVNNPLRSADSTSDIIAVQGTRPITDGPVHHIITFDGTGQSGGGTVHDLHQATAAVAPDGTPQQTAYFSGSGTDHSGLGHLFNQASGADIPNGMLEATRHLAVNFRDGDSADFDGYSRGGFQALSITGLIERVGIIDGSNMTAEQIDNATLEALDLYLNNASDAEIQEFKDRVPTLQPVEINLGLIDPVATRLDNNDHHDLNASNAANVYVAYGLDENARFFDPIELSQLPNVTSRYFIGDHATLGGTDSSELALSAIPARWLADQLGHGYDPVLFNSLIPQPDPLSSPNDNDFGSGSFPIAIGGYEDREVQAGAELDPSIAIRAGQVAGYNPPQLDSGSVVIADLDASLISPSIIDSSGNAIRTQFDTSDFLFTGVDTSGLNFDITLQALADPQPYLSGGEQSPWQSASVGVTDTNPNNSPDNIAPTRDNNALALG